MSVEHRRFKDSVYEQLARLGKAMSAPKRLELLDLLCQGPRTVEQLAEQANVTIANTSQHLQVLRAACLVETEKRGLYVEYRLAGADVAGLFHTLRSLASARLAEIEQVKHAYFEQRRGMEPVAGAELLRRAKNGEVTVLDVRPESEFRAGHIPGAISIPITALKARLKELPKSSEIVAYCRGPYCVMALDAVELLRKKGFKAQHMTEGVIEWRARGFRIETQAQESRA